MDYSKQGRILLGLSIEEMSKRSGVSMDKIALMEKCNPLYGGMHEDRLLATRLRGVLEKEKVSQEVNGINIVSMLIHSGFSVEMKRAGHGNSYHFMACLEAAAGAECVTVKGVGATPLMAIMLARRALNAANEAFSAIDAGGVFVSEAA